MLSVRRASHRPLLIMYWFGRMRVVTRTTPICFDGVNPHDEVLAGFVTYVVVLLLL
jgi:hypothetical protein